MKSKINELNKLTDSIMGNTIEEDNKIKPIIKCPYCGSTNLYINQYQTSSGDHIGYLCNDCDHFFKLPSNMSYLGMPNNTSTASKGKEDKSVIQLDEDTKAELDKIKKKIGIKTDSDMIKDLIKAYNSTLESKSSNDTSGPDKDNRNTNKLITIDDVIDSINTNHYFTNNYDIETDTVFDQLQISITCCDRKNAERHLNGLSCYFRDFITIFKSIDDLRYQWNNYFKSNYLQDPHCIVSFRIYFNDNVVNYIHNINQDVIALIADLIVDDPEYNRKIDIAKSDLRALSKEVLYSIFTSEFFQPYLNKIVYPNIKNDFDFNKYKNVTTPKRYYEP